MKVGLGIAGARLVGTALLLAACAGPGSPDRNVRRDAGTRQPAGGTDLAALLSSAKMPDNYSYEHVVYSLNSEVVAFSVAAKGHKLRIHVGSGTATPVYYIDSSKNETLVYIKSLNTYNKLAAMDEPSVVDPLTYAKDRIIGGSLGYHLAQFSKSADETVDGNPCDVYVYDAASANARYKLYLLKASHILLRDEMSNISDGAVKTYEELKGFKTGTVTDADVTLPPAAQPY